MPLLRAQLTKDLGRVTSRLEARVGPAGVQLSGGQGRASLSLERCTRTVSSYLR